MGNFMALKSNVLSDIHNCRYIIVDKDTGEILDDAQGYGYRSPQKAYAAFAYKTRDKSKDKEKAKKRKHIEQWLRIHKEFAECMDTVCFEIEKGSWGPDAKFNTKTVNELLQEFGLIPDFSAAELLRVWRKM